MALKQIARYEKAQLESHNVNHLAQQPAGIACNQLRDCVVATHKSPKKDSHFDGVDIESI